MARLRDIEVRESSVTYSNQRGWFFHSTAHHVRALLLHFLPRGYVLDGSSKFSVVFGQRPAHDQPYQQSLGVSISYVQDFDIEAYMDRPRAEQQEIMLTALTRAMRDAASLAGTDPAPIDLAAAAVRAHAFCCDIAVDKLCRLTPDRRLRVNVVRRLEPVLGEIWQAVVLDRSGAVLGIEQIKEPGIDRTSHLSKSRWSGDVFQIVYSYLNSVEYELDVSKYR